MPKMKHRLFPFIVAISACFLLFGGAAHAYIDPGTQTMVIQVFGIALGALGTFAGLMLLRFNWNGHIRHHGSAGRRRYDSSRSQRQTGSPR